MTFNEYQKEARKTAIYPDYKSLEYVVLGLCSEAGEVAGKLKKVIRDNGGMITPEIKTAMLAEVGDCFWYLAMLCTELDSTMDQVAEDNLTKLFSRLQRNTLGGSGDQR